MLFDLFHRLWFECFFLSTVVPVAVFGLRYMTPLFRRSDHQQMSHSSPGFTPVSAEVCYGGNEYEFH